MDVPLVKEWVMVKIWLRVMEIKLLKVASSLRSFSIWSHPQKNVKKSLSLIFSTSGWEVWKLWSCTFSLRLGPNWKYLPKESGRFFSNFSGLFRISETHWLESLVFWFLCKQERKKINFKHILNFHDTLYFCILQGAQCQQKWSFCCCLFNYLSFTLLPHF